MRMKTERVRRPGPLFRSSATFARGAALLGSCAAGLAVVLAASPAWSAGVPGSPASPITGGCFPQLFETQGISEVQTRDLTDPTFGVPALQSVGICDGYVVMLEPAVPGGPTPSFNDSTTWSDVVVFHGGAGSGLPSGACGPAVHFATMISDGMFPERAFPSSGPLLRLPDGGVAPDGGVPLEYGGMPANLVGLTVEDVKLGNTIVGSEGVFSTGAVGMAHDAGASAIDAGVSSSVCSYKFFSDLPALPVWAFGLLGSTLLGAAVVIMRRARGQSATLV